MVKSEIIAVLMRTKLHIKPVLKTIDTSAKFKNLGDQVKIDLNLNNRKLLKRRLVINENHLVYHGKKTYPCLNEAVKICRPHHPNHLYKLLS